MTTVIHRNNKKGITSFVGSGTYLKNTYLQRGRDRYVGRHTKLKPWSQLSSSAKKDRMIWLYRLNALSAEKLYFKYYRTMYKPDGTLREIKAPEPISSRGEIP